MTNLKFKLADRVVFQKNKEDFPLENGTLTQTIKLKRLSVLDQYQAQLQALYS